MSTGARLAIGMLAACAACVTVRAQDARPLPDTATLARAVRENLARAERLADLYSFKERRTDVHTNPFGRLGTGGTTTYEVYPSPTRGLTYRRAIDRNGVRVTPQELADQDQRYRERAAEILRQLAEENPDARTRRDVQLKRAADRARERIEDVLGVLQFKVERREIYAGVPAIVVSFTPRPSAQPRTRYGIVAQKFVGTAWIHEDASEVMRLEAKSIDDISYGFGLVARLGEGTTAVVTRRQIAPGVWMPIELRLKGRGRVVVLRALVVDFAVEWFDYRRLDEDSPLPFPDSGVHSQPGSRPQ
jgi:hypothetical protein